MSDSADDRDLLAAEYAMGLLEPYEARALEAVAARDPGVAASIARWEERLAPMAALAPTVAPPPVLWSRLELATGIRAPLRAEGRPPSSVRRPGAAVRAWRSPGLWRGVATLAIAASVAAFVLLPPRQSTQFVAALVPASGQPSAFVATVRGDGRVVLTAVSPGAVPNDRDLELWALTQGASAPVSLGVLPAVGRTLSPAVEPGGGTQLLVSLEPRGGSPTGKPTGAVLYQGAMASVAR